MRERKDKIFRIAMSVVGVLAVVMIGLFCYYMLWEKAPDISSTKPDKPESTDTMTAEPLSAEDDFEGVPFGTERADGIYTILLVGNDDGNGNTDTIMVGRIDTVEHKMDFVSIPRDTLINVDWSVRKINSVYWGSNGSRGDGIKALKMHIKKLIGFEVDCYAVIDLSVFIDTVDALGGVYFDVPQDLDYEDASQDLYIHIPAGYQLLNGYDAMGVCRYRSGYVTGDFGRIEMQHKFLKACAEQFITLGNIPNIGKVADILSSGTDTNLTAANIAFFLRQAMKCNSEDINFYTAPSVSDSVYGYSYAIIDLYPWLTMVNERLNPYSIEISSANVDIVYRSDGGYKATTSLKGEWYYTTAPSPDEPEPSPEPSPEPTPEGPTIIVIPPEETDVPGETDPPDETDAPEETDAPAETDPPEEANLL